MRVHIIRISRDRFEHFFFGRFLPAFLARGNTQIIMRDEALGINRERLGQLGHGLIEFRLPVIHDPEGAPGKFILGRKRDRFFQGQLGRFEPAGAKVNRAEIRERIKIVRALGQDLFVLLFRGAKFSRIKIRFRFAGQRNQFIRHTRLEGGLDIRPGRTGRRALLRHGKTRGHAGRICVGGRHHGLTQKRQFFVA